jgi:hypothetical protein
MIDDEDHEAGLLKDTPDPYARIWKSGDEVRPYGGHSDDYGNFVPDQYEKDMDDSKGISPDDSDRVRFTKRRQAIDKRAGIIIRDSYDKINKRWVQKDTAKQKISKYAWAGLGLKVDDSAMAFPRRLRNGLSTAGVESPYDPEEEDARRQLGLPYKEDLIYGEDLRGGGSRKVRRKRTIKK